MQITWQGSTCFTISTKKATIITDPNDPKKEADIVTASNPDIRALAENIPSKPRIVDWPGEMEVKDVFVIGIPTAKPTKEIPDPPLIFVVQASGIMICHLDGLKSKLEVEQLERVGDIDILILPIDKEGLDSAKAKEVMEQIDPRVIIVMSEDDEQKAKFFESIGREPELLSELKIDKKDLPVDNSRLLVLSQSK